MKFFNFSKKEHPHGAAMLMDSGGGYTKRHNKREFIEEGYQHNVIVYRAIREITNAIADVDIKIKQNDEVIEDHPALELLSAPNPMQGQGQFLKNIFTDYMISGEMFIAKDKDGLPVELWPLNPLNMDVKPGPGGIPTAYVHKANNKEKQFPVNSLDGGSQIYMQKMYNPLDYWRGQSPMMAAALSADTHNHGVQWNYKLLRNSGRPSGLIEFQNEPSGETISFLREFFKKRVQGSENSGEIPMLSGGAKWQAMDNTPRDMDFNSTLKETAKYIASAFGVPLPLIDNDASTFNNLEQAKERLWTDTVIPLLNEFLNNFGNWLLPLYGDNLKFFADLDSIPALESVRERRVNRTKSLVDSGIMSIDEAREDLGLEPRGGMADSLFVNGGKIPLALAGFEDVVDEDKAYVMELRAAGYDDAEIKAVLEDSERVPPKAAQKNAKRGLDLREEYGRGGTGVGVARARDISNGATLSEDTIQRMASFNRHRGNYKPDEEESDGGPTAGTIAWLLWGGTEGVDWALRKSEKIEEQE
jgi:HK97 family phage portal protein